MAEVTGHNSTPIYHERSVELRMAAKLENLAALRTLVSAAATFEDLDVDVVADLRLAVDEACTALIRSAAADSTLVLVIDPRDDAVAIIASTTCLGGDVIQPGSFSWHVLRSLTDEVQTFSGGNPDGQGPHHGRVFGITLTARRASLLQ
jgi:serine/threonine-protein kinase RsbW